MRPGGDVAPVGLRFTRDDSATGWIAHAECCRVRLVPGPVADGTQTVGRGCRAARACGADQMAASEGQGGSSPSRKGLILARRAVVGASVGPTLMFAETQTNCEHELRPRYTNYENAEASKRLVALSSVSSRSQFRIAHPNLLVAHRCFHHVRSRCPSD